MPSPAEMSEAVRRAYEAFNRRDLDAFRALAAPDEDNWGTWETVWGDIEQVLQAGPDRVLVLARHAGRARGGPEIAQARGVLVTFAQTGKMREIRFFAEPGEALAAAGLDEHSAA